LLLFRKTHTGGEGWKNKWSLRRAEKAGRASCAMQCFVYDAKPAGNKLVHENTLGVGFLPRGAAYHTIPPFFLSPLLTPGIKDSVKSPI